MNHSDLTPPGSDAGKGAAEQEKRRQEQPGWPQGPSPRPLRYGWAVVVSLLLGLSLLLDRNSAWLPLINRAIDLLQQQSAPIENR